MQIEYCDTCRKKLTEQDFADGHAVRSGNQTYCKECGSKVQIVAPVPGRGPGSSGTRLNSPSTGVIRRGATPAHALRPPSSVGGHRPASPPRGTTPGAAPSASPPKGVMPGPTPIKRTPPPGQAPGQPGPTPPGANRTIVPPQGTARGSSGTQHAASARSVSGAHARRSSPHNRVVGIAKQGGNTAVVWVSVIGVIVGVLAGVGIIALFLRH